MKKIISLASSLVYLTISTPVLAQEIKIEPPTTSKGPVGYTNISDFLNAAVRLMFIAALIIALVMLIWGALEWILSGGSKEGIDAARKRIQHALVGLAILAVAFAIISLAGQFLGIDLLGNFIIPSPGKGTAPISK